MPIQDWLDPTTLQARAWTCGHCGMMVGGDKGYRQRAPGREIYLCPACDKPTFFLGDVQVPGVAFGKEVGHLPADVAGVYREARNCMSVNAFTAAVLACR